jgi:hypothetical protein
LGTVKSSKWPWQLSVIVGEINANWNRNLFGLAPPYFQKNILFLKKFEYKYTPIMDTTSAAYDSVIAKCRALFTHKMHDYGCAWRILRLPSLTDQIFIKAQRIRSLQENEVRKVDEGEAGEFIGIINYSIMALIQLELGVADQPDLTNAVATSWYDAKIKETKTLMENKNHDYGEAWRDMRVSSLTDLIIQKLLRVKQIEDNKGKTLVSEGIDANYQDMINYAIFALILMNEHHN